MTAQQLEGTPFAVELRGVEKRFDTVQALDGVDLAVRAGTVHALLGENGAGKSTLMRVVYGLIAPDAGVVRIAGSVAPASVRDAMRLGVGMVHQHLSLVPTLTAEENLVLGGRGRLDPRLAARRLQEVSDASGLRVPHHLPVHELTIVEQQRLEILKALARGARVLILDEPTAMLAPSEVRDLLAWLRRFADGGGTVVLVTHKLREALAVADDVTVLRRGRVVHRGAVSASSEHTLARAIFPEVLERSPVSAIAEAGRVVVRALSVDIRNSRGGSGISDASFELRAGEIVGVAAVEGSGHRELLRALTGLLAPARGALQLPDAIAIIPADRTREALIPEFTLTENLALRGAGARSGLMSWPALRVRAMALVERFSIMASSVEAASSTLSGGNQQRFVVGRELESAIDLVVADSPTSGLDIRATSFVRDQLRAAAAQGAVVVVHSGDLDELLSLASRILVVFNGTVREVAGNRDAVGNAMLGAA